MAHSEHVMPPEPAENRPGSQGVSLDEPFVGTTWPDEARAHVVDPFLGCHSPSGHNEHSDAPEPLNAPAGHGICSDAPSATTKYPALASQHIDEASQGASLPGKHLRRCYG